MNTQNKTHLLKSLLLTLSIAAGGLFIFVLLAANSAVTAATTAQAEGTPYFLPIIEHFPPPTPTPVPPVPQFVKNVQLPSAECPNHVAINENTGIAYVVNSYSNDVSIFVNGNYQTNIATGGEWPSRATVDPDSDRAYVTNLHNINGSSINTPLTAFKGANITGTYNQYFEGHTPLFNPFNDYLYVTDLDSNIRVFNAAQQNLTYVTDIGYDEGIRGWITSIILDPETGRVFATSWDHGKVYVIEGTNLIQTMDANTWGPANLAVDTKNHLLFVVGQEVKNRPDGYPANNVSIFNTQPPFQRLASFSLAQNSIATDFDPISGLTYVVNPLDNSVSVFSGTRHLRTLSAGNYPWHVKVHPETGYAFVANQKSNDITVFKDGQFVKTIPSQGVQPVYIDVDVTRNDVYVINRGNEHSVFDCGISSVTFLR